METHRNCPECNKQISYSNAGNCQQAERFKKTCRSCAQSKRTGERNSFWGKTHSKEAVKKQACSHKKTWNTYTPEQKETATKILSTGREVRATLGTNQDIWKTKGAEYADKKQKAFKAKLSARNSGSGNPMFGKPSPQGSGNGWKGRLDGKYCRSLREAVYIAKHLEGVEYESGELRKFKIEYINPLGKLSNYYPDFVTEKLIIECKPRNLWKTPLIKAKAKAAVKFAKKIGKRYKLVDVVVNCDIVQELIKTNRWKFDARYQTKYDAYLNATVRSASSG